MNSLPAIVLELAKLTGTILVLQGSKIDPGDQRYIDLIAEATYMLGEIQAKLSALEADKKVTKAEIQSIRGRQHELETKIQQLAGE